MCWFCEVHNITPLVFSNFTGFPWEWDVCNPAAGALPLPEQKQEGFLLVIICQGNFNMLLHVRCELASYKETKFLPFTISLAAKQG